jgi:hypothetical protein
MASLVLDPYQLAVPSVAEGADAARRYVDSLVTWSALTDEPWLTVLTTDDTVTALSGAACYPAVNAVATLREALGLEEVSPEDVANALSRLLQSAASWEDHCGVVDVLLDPRTLTPELPATRCQGAPAGTGRNAPSVHDATRRVLTLSALLTHCAPDHSRNRELSTLDRFCAGAGVTVAGSAVIIERRAGCVLPELPDPFPLPTTRVWMREGAGDCLRALDPVLLWVSVATPEAYVAAIRVEIMRREPSWTWEDTDRFTLGCEFVAWLARHNFDRQEPRVRKLLLSCAETVLGRNAAATHALREGNGPTAPQRTRARDKAWRRDVDHEFHLHYWELPGGRFEFGNVVSHNVFTIPYCQ